MDCLRDPQSMLYPSFENKNLHDFKLALRNGADPEIIDQITNLSVFETILQKPNAKDFINACIENHVDVNKENTYLQKSPIHFAVDSNDVNNIKQLVKTNQISDINIFYNHLTPLHQIIKNLTDEHFDKQFNCIKYLLNNKCNINLEDYKSMAPVLTIIKLEQNVLSTKYKSILIKYLLENTFVDVKTCRNGIIEKELLTHYNEFYDLIAKQILLYNHSDNAHITVDKLENFLKLKQENLFIQNLTKFMDTNENDNLKRQLSVIILPLAINGCMIKCVEKLLENKINPNMPDKDNKTPLEITCMRGYWRILKILLDNKELSLKTNEEPLLNIIIKHLNQSEEINDNIIDSNDNIDYNKCFNLLIKEKHINVNDYDKLTKSTPLHLAIRFNNEKIINLLLEKNPYLGNKNIFNDITITNIKSKQLENYFNKCISTNNKNMGDEDFEILINYKCLNKNNDKQLINNNEFNEEMLPIEYISKTDDLKYLLLHPFISSFLYLKWHRLGIIYYINLLFYLFYYVSTLLYIIINYCNDNLIEKTLLWYLTLISTFYIVIREFTQFLLSPLKYIFSFINIMELIIIIMTILILFNNNINEYNKRIIGSILILLISIELSLIIGSIPILSISTHMVMLKTVSINFFKSLMLFSIIILAFTLAFFTLLGGNNKLNANTTDSSIIEKDNEDKAEDDADNDDFNKFSNFKTSIIKTIVMLTGEFDAADSSFSANWMSYLLFLLFVLFVSIVLVNLLNGLAVTDTQQIKSEAELVGLITRAELLARYEKIILGSRQNIFTNKKNGLTNLLKRTICLFPHILKMNTIVLTPNLNNAIYVMANSEEKLMDNSLYETRIPLTPYLDDETKMTKKNYTIELFYKNNLNCFKCVQCSRMDGKILKFIKEIVYKNNNNRNNYNNDDDINMQERLKSIEHLLKMILMKKQM